VRDKVRDKVRDNFGGLSLMTNNPWLDKSGDAGRFADKRDSIKSENDVESSSSAGASKPEVAASGRSYVDMFLGDKRNAAPSAEYARMAGRHIEDAGKKDANVETSIDTSSTSQATNETSSDSAEQPVGENSAAPIETGALLKQLLARRSAQLEERLPRLSAKTMRRMARNFNELSLIEGNLRGMNRDLSILYCTSCFPNEGKTTAALQLAYGLAVQGRSNVLLIETSVEKTQLATMFGCRAESGIHDFLNGAAILEEAILPTAYAGLFILPGAGDPATWRGDEIKKLMALLRANFDYVVIDGRSVLDTSEPLNLAPLVDVVVVAVECERTKWEVLQAASEKLKAAGAAHIAVVLTKRRFYVPKIVYRMISNR
jgi:Mrp family chromosome partitioning ATPase